MKRFLTVSLFAATGLILGAMILSAALIRASGRGRTYDDAQSIPHRHAGLVLGCTKLLSNGKPNPFFLNRISAAVRLYQAGKVDYLLVSGENHADGYNEAADMQAALVRSGVPPQRIVCDHDGLRTVDSVIRAKSVFGETQYTVISQRFHNLRAIFIAGHRGIDAIGYNAQEDGSYVAWRVAFRERFADIRAMLDIFVLHTEPRVQSPVARIAGP
jgi:SanA protein